MGGSSLKLNILFDVNVFNPSLFQNEVKFEGDVNLCKKPHPGVDINEELRQVLPRVRTSYSSLT